jgi:hypothetical protein
MHLVSYFTYKCRENAPITKPENKALSFSPKGVQNKIKK